MVDKIEAAIEDIKQGKIVIVCDDEDRENEGDFILAAEKVTPEAINFLVKEGRGLVCVPVSSEIAERLDLRLQMKQNAASTDCNFTDSVDAVSVHTGISAFERAETILMMLGKDSKPTDFRRPGHVFPLIAKDGGVLVRAGHTEAAVDLARLAGLKSAGVICEIMSDDGSMARFDELKEIAKKHDLKIITIKDLIEYRYKNDKLVELMEVTDLPTKYGDFKLHAFKSLVDSKLHLALVKGQISNSPTVVRVHSECMTGDVFGSMRCDCQDQLHAALDIIGKAESGVLLYMRQEGRGIGLLNKLKAYNLQSAGFDTVQANERLGFKADLRHYGEGAQILSELGVSEMKLLTNNPKKVVGLEAYGLKIVERLPLSLPSNIHNEAYLAAKKQKLGHLFESL